MCVVLALHCYLTYHISIPHAVSINYCYFLFRAGVVGLNKTYLATLSVFIFIDMGGNDVIR